MIWNIVESRENLGKMVTHVSTHTGHEDDAASTLGNHVAGSLTGSEERPVDVDVV